MKHRGRILLILMAAFSPFVAAHGQQPDNGLLISHTSSVGWQIRMIAGADAQQFSGVVESSIPFDATSVTNLTSADRATLTSKTTLSTTLSVIPGGTDGVSFSVPADAKLCLRDTGGSGVKIYVGDSLADAVPVSAPVALSSADACGATIPLLAAAAGRKYHPGHYIALFNSVDSQSVMASSIKPGVVGFMKRYTWRSLEPTLGVYDFAEIRSDLAWAKSYGMQLIVMIEDKTFDSDRPTPAYLDSYTKRNRPGGYTVLRWNTYVVARWKALVKSLGQQFDSTTSFEGIATQETSLGFDDATLNANGYTPEKYRDAYIDMLTDASKTLPTSRVFWYMNFFARNQSYIASIANAVASKGVLMGGPDVLPDDKALQSRTYPFYDQFDGKMPLFGQVEPACYGALHKSAAKTKYWTMPELFSFARDKMHVNYMIWVRVTTPVPSDSYDWLDAVPVIGSNRVFNP